MFVALRLSGDPAASMLPGGASVDARRDLRRALGLGPVGARKRSERYGEATRIVHEDRPWLELFQEVVLHGVSKRVSLEPRVDCRLLAAELTPAR